jgi:glycosyltransferase involved in cell wall biosynthesis
LKERILFLGHQPDVTGILASSDIFVLTSHYEGLPISVLEAMRAGLPVVASDAGGIPECVLDGKNGIVVLRGDLAAIRSALTRLIQSPQLRGTMGAASRQLYEERFTSYPVVEKTFNVYEAIVSSKSSRLG